jgi:hypothetical protein
MLVQSERVINPDQRVPPGEPACVFTQVRGRQVFSYVRQ